MTTIAPTRQIERLTRIKPGKARIVSCYLKLEPRDRARGKYLIKLKNRIKAAEQALPHWGLDRATAEAVRADLQRVQEFFREVTNLPDANGVALFASRPLKLFEVIPMPRVYRSRLAVDSTPLIKELTSFEDEFGRMLMAVLDRTTALFFEVTAFQARVLGHIEAEAMRGKRWHAVRGDSPGWGEHGYHNRIRQERQRHFEAIAQELFNLDRRQPAHGVILAGVGQEAKAVEPFLHPYLAKRLMGTTRLNPKEATPQAAHEAALEVRAAWERGAERAAVAEMLEEAGNGWAVNGTRATLRALHRGQVRTLLVNADAEQPGFRVAETGRLVVSEGDARGEGELIPAVDIIDDAIEEALRQRLKIDVVYDEAGRKIDGLGALLRFR
ncbi:MAG: hypothetical protein ACOY71_02030 [Gemmatimonadota bacterium]